MLKQGLFQKLQQKLSPQQIQLMKLLQVPTAELEQRIKQEIEENPALEEGQDEDRAAEEAELPEADDREESEGGDEEEFDLSDDGAQRVAARWERRDRWRVSGGRCG